jgi:ABC-type multidrug transport system permease subunit
LGKFGELIGILIASIIIFIINVMLYTIIGSFIGWIIGLTPFGSSVKYIWSSLTHMNAECWQIGAFFGFMCGFFSRFIRVRD